MVTDPRINITSDVFRAWFQDRTAEVIAEENKPVKPKFESPEMEFEPEMKSSVPRHIKIGETKNLTRIEFAGHVHITGTDEHGTRFSASGESAVYTVADRMIEMATVNGVNPVLTRGGTVAECSTVRVDVSKADPEPEGSDMRIISFEPDWEER
ncbi:hypothetical protein SDC9_136165 [bioreactor metagenome]|uniref:Uncharacterized protein n=1 Tax=bioreactor metagenome TaxID=1076179 RepID=A0A645DIH3_9ZZZZ